MELAADWLRPIYNHIRTGVWPEGVTQRSMKRCIEYLGPGGRLVKLFWTCSRPGGDVVYRWETSQTRRLPWTTSFRGLHRRGAVRRLSRFTAPLPTVATAKSIERLLGSCAARFTTLNSRPLAGWISAKSNNSIKSKPPCGTGETGRVCDRHLDATRSRPVVQRIQRALVRLKASRRHLPQPARQAIDRPLGQWRNMTVFLENGRLEIDNNLVENAIRPSALGKKNWLFIGGGADQRGAILYTLIESCRRRGIDPYSYLRDVLTRLPHLTNRQTPEITPEAWLAGQKQSQGRAKKHQTLQRLAS